MKRLLASITGFRLSIFVAVVFLFAHIALESNFFADGFFSKNGFLYRLEYAALDAKFRAREIPFDPKVVVAAIDEKSIEKYGLFPWNRKRIADLIDRLTEGGAKVIAFDIIFGDEDKNSSFRELTRFKDVYDESGLYRKIQPALLGQVQDRVAAAMDTTLKLETELKAPFKRRLDPLKSSLRDAQSGIGAYMDKSQRFYDIMTDQVRQISPDEALARAVRNSKRVVLGCFLFRSPSETLDLSPARLKQNFERVKVSGINEIFEEVNGPVARPATGRSLESLELLSGIATMAPLPLIAEATESFGWFNVEVDPDGTIRHVPMLYKINGMMVPSLSLQATALYYGGGFLPHASPENETAIDGIYLNDYNVSSDKASTFVPLDEGGKLLLNYYANPQPMLGTSRPSIPTLSIADINEKAIDPSAFKDKIVLVGATAIGTFDLRPTPYGGTIPGVYIHAVAVQNILDRSFMQRWSALPLIEGCVLLFLGVLAGFAVSRLRIGLGFAVIVAMVAGIIVIDSAFIFPGGVWMRIVAPILEVLTIFVAVTVFRYLTEEKQKRAIRQAFQFYLTKSVVDSVLNDTSKLKLGGEKREMSVMFSDIRGFTTISERLSPEDLVHLLNEYLTPMTDLVFEHEGTLDKYMGDAIMAFWGAPTDQPDHAVRACHTALDMMVKLKVMQDNWRSRNLPEVDIGIGINSGQMAVGNMGSSQRFDYTVMGDNVNLGSRLEGINKEYGTNIIISEFTYEKVKNDVYCRMVDSVRVKGKHEPVRIYELRGKGRPQGAEEQFLMAFEKGIALYKAQKWDEGIATFRACLEMNPTDYCAKKYIERCESMKAEPPGADWDGVYTMKTK